MHTPTRVDAQPFMCNAMVQPGACWGAGRSLERSKSTSGASNTADSWTPGVASSAASSRCVTGMSLGRDGYVTRA
eukprot:9377317-Pyramimonas_sp.AAC.2